jgi:hypothetical protein
MAQNMVNTLNASAQAVAASELTIWHNANSAWVAGGGQGAPPPIPVEDVYSLDAAGNPQRASQPIPGLQLAVMPTVTVSPSTGIVNADAQSAAIRAQQDQAFMMLQMYQKIMAIAAKEGV